MNDEHPVASMHVGAAERANLTCADLQRVVDFFESLTLASTARINQIYAPDAWFKDPFNEVRGPAAIAEIFRHMYTQVDSPRFIISSRYWHGLENSHESGHEGDQAQEPGRGAILTWDFLFRLKRFSRAEQCIRGATHLRFDEQGRIVFHRDYWDAAEELYEKLPVLGGLMRLLKRAARS